MMETLWKAPREARRVGTEARDETASTTSLLRVMNERAVFERIRELGPVSRPQLAVATNLSKPTISLALANLERYRLVRAVGHRTGSTGRAAQLYEMRPDAGSKSDDRVMRKLTAVAYNIAQGSIATYYPEANVLIALDHYDVKSGTPSYKSTPVLLRRATEYCADWPKPLTRRG